MWTGGPSGGLIDSASNWSAGLSGPGNVGSISGAATATIRNRGDLDGTNLAMGGTARVASQNHLTASAATVTLSDAARMDVKGDLTLSGVWNAASTTFSVADESTLTIGHELEVGDLASATLVISGGTVTSDRSAGIATGWGGSDSPVHLTGGSWSVEENLDIGRVTKGHLKVAGGRLLVGGDTVIGRSGATAGSSASLSSGRIETGSLTVGQSSTASFSQSGGTFSTGGAIKVGASSSAGGSQVELSGGTLQGGLLEVGRGNSGTFTQSGGVSQFAGTATFGVSNGYHSNFDLSGGSFSTGSDLGLNLSTTARFTGGSAHIGGNLKVDDWDTVLHLSGTALSVGGNLATGSGATVHQSAGTIRVAGNVDVGSGYSTYRLTGGSLAIDGALINRGTADRLIWSSGGTLTAYSPQSEIHATGTFTAGPGAVLDLDHRLERLIVNGSLTLDGLLIDGYDLDLGSRGGAGIQRGTINLITASSLTGSNYSLTGFTSGQGTRINPGDSFNASTDPVWWVDLTAETLDIHWSVPTATAVPEPRSLLLLGFALPLLRRRRL